MDKLKKIVSQLPEIQILDQNSEAKQTTSREDISSNKKKH